MKTVVVNNAERGIKDFTSPIIRLLDRLCVDHDIAQYSDLHDMDINGKYDRIILSASPMGDDIVDDHLPFYNWVESYGKPIFGICAGHQIIGKLYGSELRRGTESEDGMCQVRIDDLTDPIFSGYRNEFFVIQHHNDSISLPEDFRKLAHSEKCEVQVMRHKSKPIVTVQFHAEELNYRMIRNFYTYV